jgi:hypothetical protein
MADLARLAAEAGSADPLVLPREEAHPAGMLLGAAGFGLGLLAAQVSFAGRETLGWVALAMLCVAMWLHARLRRVAGGWRVDFAARRVEPLGPASPSRDAPVALDGAGWSIQVAPGGDLLALGGHDALQDVAHAVDLSSGVAQPRAAALDVEAA